MLSIKTIREHPEEIKVGAKDKRITVDIDQLLTLDREIKPLQTKWETLQAERNSLSKTIGKSPAEERQVLKEKVLSIKGEMDQLTVQLKEKKFPL